VRSTLLGVSGNVATISVGVDPAWLASPARVFPVLIDPTFYANTAQAGRFDAYVDSAYPNETEGTYDPGVLKLGTYNGGGEVGRVLMYFNTAGSLPAGAQVSDAYVAINNNYSFSCPNGSTPSVGLFGLGAGWSDRTVTWNNQPPGDGQPASSATVFAKGYNSGCPGGYVNLPATSLAQRWANGQADRGVQLGTVENNSYGWKKFYPGEAGGAAAPAMYITYSTNCTFYPQTNHSVCGAIRDRYNALGGPGGFLGYPSIDAVLNPDGVGLRQQLTTHRRRGTRAYLPRPQREHQLLRRDRGRRRRRTRSARAHRLPGATGPRHSVLSTPTSGPRTRCNAEESAGTDSARMWRTWLTADTAVPQGQAQQVPFCTG